MEGFSEQPKSRAEKINAVINEVENNPELSKIAALKEMIEADFVSPSGEDVDPEEYLAKVTELHENQPTLSVEDVLAKAEQNAAEAHWDPRREDSEDRPN